MSEVSPSLSATKPEQRPTAAVDVILRDGSTLRLRAPARTDADALAAFFGGLSDRSSYLRFHGIRRIDASFVEHFLEPDWQDKGVLVGELADAAGAGRIVAVAEYVRLRDETGAEAAFVVADEHQGRGIGTRLLERLAARAAEAGIERFVAEVLPENLPMLKVFEGTGLEVSRELDGGEIEVEFPIAPTERYRSRIDERDHLACPHLDHLKRVPAPRNPVTRLRHPGDDQRQPLPELLRPHPDRRHRPQGLAGHRRRGPAGGGIPDPPRRDAARR